MLKLSHFQWFVHIGSWIPLAVLIYDYLQGNLTANPIQAIEQRTGLIAINLLMISLSCTPLNTLFGFRPAIKVRRALGLYAFMYACLHFLTFFFWDYAGNITFIWMDVNNKLYIFVGAAALLTLIPLALTSTKSSMRRLGKRWKRLHKLVYATGILVVFHYIWAVKADIRQPLAYGAVLLFLLLVRWPAFRRLITSKRSDWLPRVRHHFTSNPSAPEIK